MPLGVPKYIVSTVSFSPLIPAERLPADVQMILWAGGFTGSMPSAKRPSPKPQGPFWGGSRRGKAGYETPAYRHDELRQILPVLHGRAETGTGIPWFRCRGVPRDGDGGRAFESLAAQGAFACVMDFATQEVGNYINGSAIHAGESRLTAAGRAGIPQIVSSGCYDLVDLAGWQPMPGALQGLPSHAHNRLLTSVVLMHPAAAMWRELWPNDWQAPRARRCSSCPRKDATP